MQRRYTAHDKIIIKLSQLKKITGGCIKQSNRISPADEKPDYELNDQERHHVAGLMRINHTGEVCAQALYDSQAAISRNNRIKQLMQQAAVEEYDHLYWCQQRLLELDSRVSYLNPLWYLGSWFIGSVAALAGDQWNLGFVEETEHQVTQHLAKHRTKVPLQDTKTAAILQQMQYDESVHAHTAHEAGAQPLPTWIKTLMGHVARVMTSFSYYI